MNKGPKANPKQDSGLLPCTESYFVREIQKIDTLNPEIINRLKIPCLSTMRYYSAFLFISGGFSWTQLILYMSKTKDLQADTKKLIYEK